jgi:acyl dehydratase
VPADRTEPGAAAEATAEDGAALRERLLGYIGLQVEPPVVAPEPVNHAMVRNWCEAVGDTNPVYLDAEAAARSPHGGLVAPPAMIQAWFFPPLGTVRPAPGSLMAEIIDLVRRSGYPSVVATNSDQRHVRYARHGERLERRTSLTDVSEQKRTRLGIGFFLTTQATIEDERQDVVCSLDYRRFYFRPAAADR